MPKLSPRTTPVRARSFPNFIKLLLPLVALLASWTATHAQQHVSGYRLVGQAAPASSSFGGSGSGTRALDLLIPVEGIAASDLRDTFEESRSEGRDHNAIDIHAPRGTPVVAVTDGRIVKLHSGARGGLSVYQVDPEGRMRFYYAHLDSYEPGIAAGVAVRRGDVIGYVGDSGNAAPGDTHLHFSISILDSPSRWWQGTNLNPYTLLRAQSIR